MTHGCTFEMLSPKKENMINIKPQERPRMMYMIPRHLRYYYWSNFGIKVTTKAAKQAIAIAVVYHSL